MAEMIREANHYRPSTLGPVGTGQGLLRQHADGPLPAGDEEGHQAVALRLYAQRQAREMGLGVVDGAKAVFLTEGPRSGSRISNCARGWRRSLDRQEEEQGCRARMPTFGQFADLFISEQAQGFRNAKHIAQWKMTMEVYAKRLRSMQVDKINTSDVLSVLKLIWVEKPETAKRTQGRIERILDAAKAQGLRTGENPARWRGHLDMLLPRQSKLSRGHHKALPYAEVPSFISTLRGSQAISAFALEFLILTAARTGEVIGARWREARHREGNLERPRRSDEGGTRTPCAALRSSPGDFGSRPGFASHAGRFRVPKRQLRHGAFPDGSGYDVEAVRQRRCHRSRFPLGLPRLGCRRDQHPSRDRGGCTCPRGR